jgi:hypothetical protein
MTKGENKWYKTWWFYTILGFILLIFVNSYISNQIYYSQAKQEYNQIYSEIENIDSRISQIENKYSKNGLLYYYEFSNEDLEEYVEIIDKQEKNLDELINWVFVNEKYLRAQGKSDLMISQLVQELRIAKQKVSDTKLQAGNVENLQDTFDF